jgi:hypothetical protein
MSDFIDPSIDQQVFAALNLLVFKRLDADSFQITSPIPDWYEAFFPELIDARSRSDSPPHPQLDRQMIQQNVIQRKSQLSSVFPFLDYFLEEAEAFWHCGDRRILKSGFWSETNAAGQECQLEATAICGSSDSIFLIELADVAYQEKQTLIQTGRMNELSYVHFTKETEKKEILLHCIFHDLAGQLLTFRFCLELLKREVLSEQGRDRLEIGLRQVRQQENLMREVLQAFSAEVAAPEAAMTDAAQAPDLLVCARSIISTFIPAFSLQNKQLEMQIELDPTQRWQIVGDRSRLERVLANLVENALRHTPEQSTVTLRIQEEDQFLRCAIEDQGEGVPPEAVKFLFQRFFQGSTRSGKAGLGLYFCRITVEQWGGTIGYSPTASGGAQFWIRLRKLLQGLL